MSPAIKIFQPLPTKQLFDNLALCIAFLWWNLLFPFTGKRPSVCAFGTAWIQVCEGQSPDSRLIGHFRQLLMCSLPRFPGINGSQVRVSITWALSGEGILPGQKSESISNLGTLFVTDVSVRYKGTTRALAKDNSCHHSWALVTVTVLSTAKTIVLHNDVFGIDIFVTRFGVIFYLLYCYIMKYATPWSLFESLNFVFVTR